MNEFDITQMLDTKFSNAGKTFSIWMFYFNTGYFVVESKKKFFIWRFLKQMARDNLWCSCQAEGWKI